MHELSLVASIVDSVTESLVAYPGAQVKEVRLRVGALAAVEQESLLFCFGIATEGTALEGSSLVIKHLPVVVYCAQCKQNSELQSLQSFRCTHCGTLTGELVQGRELEIEDIEIETEERQK